jgi:glyoxylase-like metal-dependent hydrolase (beta-lactamase superfamily II)
MQLHAIETGRFKLDGGAMFGVVPKVLWQRTNPADENNRIDMAARCLLIEDNNRLILIDTGIGTKSDSKFAANYAIDNRITLDISLEKLGFTRKDITDVILTHLHFDHCGGSTEWEIPGEKARPAFVNANYYVQKNHLTWALSPNPREKASFLNENIQPLVSSGQLIELEQNADLFPWMELIVINGHTEAQQLPLITWNNKKYLFAADLFPTVGHLPLPFVMSYDVRPLVTLSERLPILESAAQGEFYLFLEHDPIHECVEVIKNEKGGFTAGEKFNLTDN